MCAYSQVNGLSASENPWLLTTVLREKFGFEGMVVSDWGAVFGPLRDGGCQLAAAVADLRARPGGAGIEVGPLQVRVDHI
jgi:beta-glucosidase